MYLKSEIDIIAFLNMVDRCIGDVTLHTAENDILNLRSELCRYVFAVVHIRSGMLKNARIHCQHPEDAELLADFLTETL